MRAALLFAGTELRARWRGLVLLGVFAGLVGVVVLGAVAGARRTDTSVDRLRTATRARDLMVQVDHPSLAATLATELGSHPDVVAAGTVRYFPALPVGAEDDEVFAEGMALVSSSTPPGRLPVDRPLVVRGRLPSVDAPLEVAIDEGSATALGVDVGDVMTVKTFTPEDLEALYGGTTSEFTGLRGPRLEVDVVGVVRAVDSLLSGGGGPGAIMSAGFDAAYGSSVGGPFPQLVVHLRDRADLPAVEGLARARIAELAGDDPEVIVADSGEEFFDSADRAVGVMATGLWLFAAVAGLAGAVAVAQAVARQLTATASSPANLDDLGLTRVERATALALPVGIAVLVAAGVAVVGMWALSPVFPLGLARRAEPSPGAHLDGIVMALGVTAFAAATTVVAFVAAARHRTRAWGPARSPGLATRLARSGAPPTVLVGAHFAFGRVTRRGPVPVWSAVVGIAIGTLGVVAATTVRSSVDGTVSDPSRWGWTWSMTSDFFDDGTVEAIAEDDEVAVFGWVLSRTAELSGTQVEGLALAADRGSLNLTMLDGRPPTGAGEVALARGTMDDLGVGIGDAVAGPDGDLFEVVGMMVMPSGFDSRDAATGAAFTEDGLARAATSDGYEVAALTFADGVDAAAATTRLEGEFGLTLVDGVPPAPLQDVDRATGPARWLGLFFALLAVAGLSHALTVSVRRRRGDVAVLRALGFQRGDVRRTVVCQAVLLASVAGIVGVAAGVIVGRWVSHVIVTDLGVADVATTPAALVLLAAPVAIGAAALIAIVPAVRSSRRSPVSDLRVL